MESIRICSNGYTIIGKNNCILYHKMIELGIDGPRIEQFFDVNNIIELKNGFKRDISNPDYETKIRELLKKYESHIGTYMMYGKLMNPNENIIRDIKTLLDNK